MALGASYATVPDLEARLGRTDDGTFAALLDAASRAVEAFCQRQFNTDNTATPRTYEADDCEFLAVDDFHTTADLAIEVDGETIDVADVEPRPRNGVVNGQPGWPFWQLWAVDTTWPTWRWNRLVVTVTAQWGWASPPEAVKQATLDVASVMSFGVGGQVSGPVRSVAIDGYSESYSTGGLGNLPDEQAPVELRKAVGYRRRRFGVA